MDLQNIEWLIADGGDIAVGSIGPVECAASAANSNECLALLARREGESVSALLERLDAAIGKAQEGGPIVDEINR